MSNSQCFLKQFKKQYELRFCLLQELSCISHPLHGMDRRRAAKDNIERSQEGPGNKVPFTGHVRVKHKCVTYFLQMDVSEKSGTKIAHLKRTVAVTMGVEQDEIQICLEPKPGQQFAMLADDQLLTEAGIINDAIVYALLPNIEGEWERPEVVSHPK